LILQDGTESLRNAPEGFRAFSVFAGEAQRKPFYSVLLDFFREFGVRRLTLVERSILNPREVSSRISGRAKSSPPDKIIMAED
jgi:hypothetical protein